MPAAPPPVLYALDAGRLPADAAAAIPLPAGARFEAGQLRVGVEAPGTAAGLPLGDRTFGDAVVQAQLSLVEGDEGDCYGIFVRRPREGPLAGRFVAFAVGPAGRCLVQGFDGAVWRNVFDITLAEGMVYAPGLGDPNLLQAVVCGPQVTFLLNDQVVTSLTVEVPLQAGELGLFVRHGATSPRATLAADWVHVHGVIAPALPR